MKINKILTRKISLAIGLGILVCMLCTSLAFAWPSVYPTGTTVYNPEKAFNGYTLYSPLVMNAAPKSEPYEYTSTMYLIDMAGNIVHTWDLPFPPGLHGVLLPDGHLLAGGNSDEAVPDRPGRGEYSMGGGAGWLYELDWEGNIVFKHWDPNQHHDFDKLPNGNYMYVAWEKVPKDVQEEVRGGMAGTEHKDGTMFSDVLIEINPAGEVVWEWHSIKHLDVDKDPIGPIHTRQEWMHCNNVDVMEDGNVLTDGRHIDEMLVIDKETKEVIWRWGSPSYIDEKTGAIQVITGNKTLGGPHDANEIAPGLPGAGNFLVYDNGMYADGSRAVEVDPKTGEVVWQSPQTFIGRSHYSSFISGAERLPNGNTIICSGGKGRLFEVTKDNEIVWEYINPFEPPFYCVFRAHRYGVDYCPQFSSLPPAEGYAATLKK